MTIADILKIVKTAVIERENYPFLRLGQSLYNTLYKTYPEIADEINSKCVDPFYQDDVIPAFLAYLFAKVKND